MSQTFVKIQQAIFDIRRKRMTNPRIISAVTNYWNYTSTCSNIFPIIAVINSNGKNPQKVARLYKIIESYKPHIIFIMEAWDIYPLIDSYNRFVDDSQYLNHIYVRCDLLRGRNVENINHGFRIQDLNFRYLPPGTKKCRLYPNEFGDYNCLSNGWVWKNTFIWENRYDKIGGMGFRTTMKNKYKFIPFPSDHSAIIIELQSLWRKNLIADRNKINNAIDDIVQNNSENFKYIYKYRSNHRNYRNTNVVDPNKFNMDKWINLYGNEPNLFMKQIKHVSILGNTKSLEKDVGTNAYDINNRPAKPITHYIKERKISNGDLVKVVNAISKDEIFSSRIICINKLKNEEPKSINDIRPISILPVSMKITETSRTALKEALIRNTDQRIFSFLPHTDVSAAINNIYRHIIEDG